MSFESKTKKLESLQQKIQQHSRWSTLDEGTQFAISQCDYSFRIDQNISWLKKFEKCFYNHDNTCFCFNEVKEKKEKIPRVNSKKNEKAEKIQILVNRLKMVDAERFDALGQEFKETTYLNRLKKMVKCFENHEKTCNCFAYSTNINK